MSTGERLVGGPSSGGPANQQLDPLLADDRLTALGLVLEAWTGIREAWEPEVEEAGITGSEFDVLIRLARSDGNRLRMSELAAQSTVTHSGITRLVDRMVEAGLIDRTPCETDRRGSNAQLTAAGMELVLGLLPRHLATIDRVLINPVGEEDLAVFLGSLRRIRAEARPSSDPVASSKMGLR